MMRVFVCVLLAVCLMGADPNALSDGERQQGWRLLFDGHTTQGWVEVTGNPFPSTWTIEDGCLKAVVRPGGMQDIRTVDSFQSFELQFEWRTLAGGNSGVKYLIQKVDAWENAAGRQARARGLEYQLAGDGDGLLTADPKYASGSLYSVIAPPTTTRAVVQGFNSSRIVVDGARIEHWLNGAAAASFETAQREVNEHLRAQLPRGAKPATPLVRASPISLQHHGSEVWFRNIKIRVIR